VKAKLQNVMSPTTNTPRNHTADTGGHSATSSDSDSGRMSFGKWTPEASTRLVAGVGGESGGSSSGKQTRRRR
jgi:hypothetical protein